MKICFLCDLHLPFDENALQYDVLDWAIRDLTEKKADCVLFAGDVTCDGNEAVYNAFIEKMQNLDIPFLFIPGNSDLRCKDSREQISQITSALENEINGIKIFALNDCDHKISDEQFEALKNADASSIVFLHHPPKSYPQPIREKMAAWRESHPDTRLFYGHLHESKVEGPEISLQAMDPDKAIGECPCITYYDTETKALSKSHYLSPIPEDFQSYFGISCYDAVGQIDIAIKHKLKNLELRPNCVRADQALLAEKIALWRENGGENLCIHLSDVSYREGVVESKNIDLLTELATTLKANRFTQHVPMVSVEAVKADPNVLEQICDYLAEKINAVDHDMVVGVENMHMTAADQPDDTRRFGYIPEECIAFMQALSQKCRHKVGINFDIGHARNNAPFSQKYQISTWLSQIGKYAVGYHIHQVTLTEGKFNNHMPITDVYGKLISYASFFKCWSKGDINKAPLIFEMRPEGAYETTLQTFGK